MKNFLRILPFVLCGFAGTTFADEFKSVTITGGMMLGPIRVHGDQFMVIRNFTQDITIGAARGAVMVNAPPSSSPALNVLVAAILDKASLEVINSVVIAGPADVTATCPLGTTCFVSYKKDSN